MRLPLLLAAAVLVLAGCTSADPTNGTDAPLTERPDLIAHTSEAEIPMPAGFETFHVASFHTNYYRGEPTIGISKEGAIFATASGPLQEQVPGGEGLIARSDDAGKTWTIVDDPTQNTKTDTDPWLWVDPITNRVYNIPLYIGCSWLTWSDDLGETWGSNPVAGCVPPAHDHQKLTSGPPPIGHEEGYPSVVYYAYNSFRQDGTHVAVSRDGGATFAASVQAHPSDDCQGGINGPVAIADDGTAYLPKPVCDGPAIIRSDDAGGTWNPPVVVEGAGMHGLAFIHAAVDDAGVVYVLWAGDDQLLYLSHSTDKGETFTAPIVVSRPGIKAAHFHAIDAGSRGRIAFAYVGTTDDPKNWPNEDPATARPEAVWHFYAAIATGADGDDIQIVTQQVTPDDDPVERGCIMGSLNEPCRNLRDFIDVQVRHDRFFAVYADGCDKCTSDQDRLPRGETVVAIQQHGPDLADGSPLQPFPGRV